MKQFLTIIIIMVLSGKSFGQLPKENDTIHANGIELYYEVYGEGEPLLLLHGWTQSSRFWSDYIPAYAQHFEVYAIDLRGHGKTSQLSRDFSMKKASDDIFAFMDQLGLEKAKAIGLSYGGLILLELAVSSPDKIESMVLIGVSHSYNGSENTDSSFSFENLPESFVQHLRETHHHGESQIMALFDPNLDYKISLRDEDLKSIETKTLIVNGDRDEIMGITPAITLHENLPNSELWIVPNTGHIAITGSNQDSFLKKSLRFLQNGERQN